MPRETDQLRHQINQSLAERTRRIDSHLRAAKGKNLDGSRGYAFLLSPVPYSLFPLPWRHRVLMLIRLQIRIEISIQLAAFHVLGKSIDAVERQAQGLADVADRAPR